MRKVLLVLLLAGCATRTGGDDLSVGDLGADLSIAADLSVAPDLAVALDLSGVDFAFAPDIAPPDGGVLTPVAIAPSQKIDVLFMIDNSPSMAPKQAELINRFPGLVSSLPTAWYHIGVVTSDLGAAQFNLGGGQCHPGGDGGKLQALGAAHDPSCQAPTGGLNFIDYNQIGATNNLPAGQDLATTFSCMASVGDKGCGFEHQLESVYRALHDPIPENTGFLRSDAALVVVLLTDEDDCSADPNSDLFDPALAAQYGALLSYRCTNYSIYTDGNGSTPAGLMPYGSSGGPLQNPRDATSVQGNKLFTVDRYVDFFTRPGGVKSDSAVALVALTAAPSDVESVLANPNPQPPGPYVTCPGPVDGKTCAVVLQHSCIAPQNTQFFGDPAVRIGQVVQAAGERVVGSICDTSYAGEVQSLASLLAALGSGGCIGGNVDTNNPQCTVRMIVGASESNLPSCSAAPGSYPCWKVAAKSGCTYGQALAIDWNGATPTPGATWQAACAVTR
jgi:hypothetical protein